MRLVPLMILAGFLSVTIPSKVWGDTSTEDKDKEPTRVVPPRLILGPLAYGEDESTVLVREVKIEGVPGSGSISKIDLSHAPGISVIDRISEPDGLTLRLGINVAQFIREEPYGILIKRSVRLETTSPQEPQLLFTVIGWTGVIKTSRNFNDYLFSGHERWQGCWGTPNMAGAVLALLLILILGSAAALFQVKGSRCRGLRVGGIMFLFGLSGVGLALLAATYSRGSWIAFVAGALVLGFYASMRRFVLGVLLIFVLLVFLLPAGLKRINSYTQVQEDPSIAHRLELWVGALQMMGDYPLGVGTNQFGQIFERDYQRRDHVVLNTTAVSDYLTFGSERGLILLSLVVGSLLLILFLSLRAARARENPWQMTLCATLLSIMVASAFSTLWFVSDYQRLFALVVTGLLIFLMVQRWRDGKQSFARLLVLEGGFVSGCAVVLFIAALTSLLLQPTRSSEIPFTDSHGKMISVHRITPRWHQSKGVIVYFPGKGDSLTLLCHSTLRPLAAFGWEVWIPNDVVPDDLVSLVASSRPDIPVFVAGQKEGGRLAWSFAGKPSPVRAGAGLDFLTSDLDPARGGTSFPTPFLVFHFLYDGEAPANAAIRASRRTAFSGLHLTVQLSLEEPAAFSVGTTQWIQALDHYFSAHQGDLK